MLLAEVFYFRSTFFGTLRNQSSVYFRFKAMFNNFLTGVTFGYFLTLGFSCTFTQKIKTGDMAVDYKYYSQAILLYNDEYNRAPSKAIQAEKAYRLGLCFLELDDQPQASKWFRTAYDLDFGDEALIKFAHTLKNLQRYDQAIGIYEALLDQNPARDSLKRDILSCQRALDWLRMTQEFKVENLPLNTPSAEFSPALYLNGQLVFASDQIISRGEKTYHWTGADFMDLFIGFPDDEHPENFSAKLNTTGNEGTLAFSSDFQTIYFIRCTGENEEDGKCKLYTSYRTYNDWSDPVVLPFVQPGFNYQHPALGGNDSILIFTSDAVITGAIGQFDLYYTRLEPTGNWITPINLGRRINTESNEKFPFMDRDTLYFSSDQIGGMGGLDIYKSWVMDDGSWAPPLNMKHPINSGSDDFGFIVDRSNVLNTGEVFHGYFSSSRPGGAGRYDLYRFKQVDVLRPVDSTAITSKTKPLDLSLFLAVRVITPQRVDEADPNSKIVSHRPLANAPITVNRKNYRTNADGLLLIPIEFNQSYSISASFSGYLTNTLEVAAPAQDSSLLTRTINREIILDKIFTGKEINLSDIYYDYNEWFIRDDARPSLDRLIKLLKDNPSLTIALSSHTDCRGTDEYNLDLSQKRAQAAVDYLIGAGINVTRLTAQGLGESQLVNRCLCEQCTEEEHQQNRRTTFTIIKY